MVQHLRNLVFLQRANLSNAIVGFGPKGVSRLSMMLNPFHVIHRFNRSIDNLHSSHDIILRALVHCMKIRQVWFGLLRFGTSGILAIDIASWTYRGVHLGKG